MNKPSTYPLTDRYSLTRAVRDTLDSGSPSLNFEAEPNLRIKRQFGRFATTVGDARLRVVYIPFSEFGPGRIGAERELHLRDLGGSLFQTITGVTPSYTTGLIAQSQVFKAGATLLEGCEGQVMLVGTTTIPQPQFSTSLTEPRLLPSHSRCLLAVVRALTRLFLARYDFHLRPRFPTSYSNNRHLSLSRY